MICMCRTNDDFTCSLQQEHTLSQEELMVGVKKGILKGFLELDEKLRKIPEVSVKFPSKWKVKRKKRIKKLFFLLAYSKTLTKREGFR